MMYYVQRPQKRWLNRWLNLSYTMKKTLSAGGFGVCWRTLSALFGHERTVAGAVKWLL